MHPKNTSRHSRKARTWRSQGQLADLRRIVKSLIQTVEAQGLVPEFHADDIADCLKPLQRALCSKFRRRVGRPPKADADKMSLLIGAQVECERWATFEGFIVVKRSLPKRIREREDLLWTELKKRGFSKEQIEAGLSAKTAIIAARRFVTAEYFEKRGKKLEYSTVGKYHREFFRNESSV